MLKKIRERLIDELSYFNEELKKNKKQYEKLESEYKTGQELIRATNYQKNASAALFGGILPASSMLLIGGFLIFIFWEMIGKFLLAGEILLALCFGRNVMKNLENYNMANKRLDTARKNISDSQFDLIEELDIYEADLDIRVRYHMENYLKNIQMYEDSIKSLWSILNSDDLSNVLKNSNQSPIDLSKILEEEWFLYLEEIGKNPISEVHLGVDEIAETCYKETTEKLHVEPKKLENKPHHPLQAY